MFTEPGSARFDECVRVKAPAKIRVIARPSHDCVEAIAVIVVVPVMLNTDAALPGVMLDAEAMLEPRETSCRVKAKAVLSPSSAVDLSSVPAGPFEAGVTERDSIELGMGKIFPLK
jgi:hypothetical protein